MVLLTLLADVNEGDNTGSWLWAIFIVLAIIALAMYIIRHLR